MQLRHSIARGFTLIELAIVLVIIGLTVGGVLVGQDLIRAAAIRAQITQIEKYNTATNTFRGKYGYLPGDVPGVIATQFGLASRGTLSGEGDGNGVIQGITTNGNIICCTENGGETVMFWRDLSTAGFLDGSFTAATSTSHPAYALTHTSTPYNYNSFFPQAKIGNGNYVYVWSGGTTEVKSLSGIGDSTNYFGISVPNDSAGGVNSAGDLYSDQGMTVQQAYNIDKKMDDGMPQSGSVQAWYVDYNKTPNWIAWSSASGGMGDYDSSTGGAITPASGTNGTATWDGGTASQFCYTDGQNANVAEQYNLTYPNNVNCGLSFRFQ